MEKKNMISEEGIAFEARIADAYKRLSDEKKDLFLSALEKMLSKRRCSGGFAILKPNAVTNGAGRKFCDGVAVLDASETPVKVYDIERGLKRNKTECRGQLEAALLLIKKVSADWDERVSLQNSLLLMIEEW